MKIAICASEVVPFAKTGGMADVTAALPLALEKEGQEIIIILPYYQSVRNCGSEIRKIKPGIFFSSIGRGIKAYFIESDKYFNRAQLYGEKSGDYKDNLERFSYYSRRSLELLKEIDFSCDIIHCHDWQSALLPLYLKTIHAKDNFYKNMRTVLTIHNLGYQGLFAKSEFPKLGLDWSLFTPDALEFYGKINILKGGIVFSDIINTVSPTYSREIQTEELGFGLEGVLAKRKDSLFGVLNGLDYNVWNPRIDKIIAQNYSFKDLSGKLQCKEDLQRNCNLQTLAQVPLVGVVSRLAEQKGLDLLASELDALCKMNLQLVILGTGDAKYHHLLSDTAKKYPKNFSLHLKFDDQLAHKIYAGSDIFLMPSRYEPCGLGQLISLKYGTIPVVFKTGGLSDTVNKDRGFVFELYKKENFLKAVKEALSLFSKQDKWGKLINNAMECDFSWEESAKEYIKLYEKARRTA